MNITVPCFNCLILGLCKNKPVVECSLLYEYLAFGLKIDCGDHYERARKELGDGYRYTGGKIMAIRKIYNEEGECLWL